MRASVAIGMAIYVSASLGALWALNADSPPTVAPDSEVHVEHVEALSCDLPDPELPDLAARLDTLRCVAHRLAEVTGHPRWVRHVEGTAENPVETLVAGTRAIPGAFVWRGWPKDWDRCEVCGAGWPCNRKKPAQRGKTR